MTAALFLGLSGAGIASGQINPSSSSTNWVPLLYGNNNYPDPTADQQTGSTEGDLIGNQGNPSLYMKYHDGGTGTNTAGWLGFRFRVGSDSNPVGFDGVGFVGLDANLDGKLDIFLGIDNQGSAANDKVGIWNPGAGANTSPSTTSIVNPPILSYGLTSSNYSLMPVSASSDPFSTTNDLDADSKIDHLLTFVVPFADLRASLASLGISNFTADTVLQVVAATATQPNSLNQDLNGVNGGINSSLTWEQLGAITRPYTPNGSAPVPEPSTVALLVLGAAAGALAHRRSRSR